MAEKINELENLEIIKNPKTLEEIKLWKQQVIRQSTINRQKLIKLRFEMLEDIRINQPDVYKKMKLENPDYFK